MSSARSRLSSGYWSVLFTTYSTGVFFSLKYLSHLSSDSMVLEDSFPATTIIAISVFSAARRVFSSLAAPSSVSSSKPAVSIMTQAPSGLISIGLYTGSVVVPATSATIDTFCPVKAFINEDFPLLVLPNIPI